MQTNPNTNPNLKAIAQTLYQDLQKAIPFDPANTNPNAIAKLEHALASNLCEIEAWADDDDGLQLTLPEDTCLGNYLGTYHNTRVYYTEL